MSPSLATRIFDTDAQRRFAALSGDANPMHMDALAARRTQAGYPVVHGVHLVLWALDVLAAHGRIADDASSVSAQFKSFVYVGAAVTLAIVRENEKQLRADVSMNGVVTTTIKVARAHGSYGCELADSAPVDVARPHDVAMEALVGRAGTLPPIATAGFTDDFPHAAARLDARTLAGLAQLSTLVGMISPGLHSIFGGFDVDIVPHENESLRFRVDAVDERFRMVDMTVAGCGIRGTVAAFSRVPPVDQPTLAAIRALVAPDAFRGTTALVVGGSRGLGALTARIVAAGGGDVIVTYVVGEEDARAVAADIGGACSILRYDARADAAPQLAGVAPRVTDVYYYATAQIYQPKSELFVAERFAAFCDLYVAGFARLCAALRPADDRTLAAFYPSTVFVEAHKREMTEYAMAKAAGEMLCADIDRFEPRIRVLVERLPAMLTDQTATVVPMETAAPLDVLLPIVHAMISARTRQRN